MFRGVGKWVRVGRCGVPGRSAQDREDLTLSQQHLLTVLGEREAVKPV